MKRGTKMIDGDIAFVVCYDISNNDTRKVVSKYLLQEGCLRIQKSLFMGYLPYTKMKEIARTLKGTHEAYDNDDSYIILPIRKETVENMIVYGKRVNVDIVLRRQSIVFM